MKQTNLLSKKKGYTVLGLIAFFFFFFLFTGGELVGTGNIIWSVGYTVKSLVWSLLAGLPVGFGIAWLIYGFGEGRLSLGRKQTDSPQEGAQAMGKPPGKIFLVSLVLIVLCWLPAYLAYYPAICSYDTTVQLEQIVGQSYNTHHPVLHTLLLAGSMELGEWLFGNTNTGIGLLALGQLLVFAGALSFCVTTLYREGIKKQYLAVLQLYCMLFPFHWYMSVTISKDTLFASFFLLQMISLYVLLRRRENSFRIQGMDVLFFVSTVLMMLLRNNGKYAFLVLLTLCVPILLKGRLIRRLVGRIALNGVLAFLTAGLCLGGLSALTNAGEGDKREMLSLPIQQLARTMLYHGGVGVLAEDDNTMNDADKALIGDFLLDESYREYRGDISDPVKRHTNTYVVRYRTMEFARTYLGLMVRYPGDYINAALAVNAGYLNVGDTSHAYVNVNGVDRGLGYVQTRWVDSALNEQGIYKDSKCPRLHEWLEEWADGNAYLKLPLLKYLFVPGTYLWLYLLLLGYLLIHRRYRMCIPLSLVLGYYITLFLGPTVQLRYLYPLMILLPFVGLISQLQEQGKAGNKNEAVL